jgi:radical SAM superfamily enzyme YgiQ (UPF0313 family)
VKPGPQLKQAIQFSKRIREEFPDVHIVWGGYFASNQAKVCLESKFVDVVVNGSGGKCFPELVKRWSAGNIEWNDIPNLIFKHDGKLVTTRKDEIYDQDSLPALPFDRLARFYSLDKYLGKT